MDLEIDKWIIQEIYQVSAAASLFLCFWKFGKNYTLSHRLGFHVLIRVFQELIVGLFDIQPAFCTDFEKLIILLCDKPVNHFLCLLRQLALQVCLVAQNYLRNRGIQHLFYLIDPVLQAFEGFIIIHRKNNKDAVRISKKVLSDRAIFILPRGIPKLDLNIIFANLRHLTLIIRANSTGSILLERSLNNSQQDACLPHRRITNKTSLYLLNHKLRCFDLIYIIINLHHSIITSNQHINTRNFIIVLTLDVRNLFIDCYHILQQEMRGMMGIVLAVTVLFLGVELNDGEGGDGKRGDGLRKQRLKNGVEEIYEDSYLKNLESMEFQEWSRRYKQRYASQDEKVYRRLVFDQNINSIQRHNVLYEQGYTTFFKGINKFTAMTDQEFLSEYTWKQPLNVKATTSCKGSIMDTPNPPPFRDWGNQIGKVGDQGKCGMDWAMVAVNTVESLYALKIGVLPVLSVQQLLQCSYSYGNEGCDGGFMDQAFWYIMDHGIATNESYPYKGNRTVESCYYVLNKKFTSFSQCAKVPSGSYSKLLSAIVQQPVSVAVNMHEDMKAFTGGVYDGNCSSIVNHGMLLTGYGGEGNGTFWKLKNTMGLDFGQSGFIKIKRQALDGDGKCGIQIWPSVPQLLS